MTSYAHLSHFQTILMTLIAAVSNFGGVPLALKLFQRKQTHFEGYIVVMSIFTSFMYHLCQIYDFTLFLDELQWHRLDNIFAITSFELVILHSIGSIGDDDVTTRWATLLSSIIIQEKDPWNITYTFGPCLLFVLVAIGLRLYFKTARKAVYDLRNMQIALVPFALGLFFFYLGLDDANDYLRIYHGIWHICASVFGYYCLTSVRVVDHSTKQKIENEKDSTELQF